MPRYLHTENQTPSTSEAELGILAEFLPSGTGYLEKKADGTLVLSQPAGTGNGTAKKPFSEKLTITSDNVFPPLSFTPSDVVNFWVDINGGVFMPVSGAYTVNATTKVISQTSGTGYGVKAGWNVVVTYYTDDDTSAPTITSVSPSPVTVGQTFTITGTGFTQSSVVVLGGQTVTATVVNTTQITVVIPPLVFTGNTITVTTATGVATNNGFNFTIPLAIITSFTPATAVGNSVITITGTNFYVVSAVKFGGTDATSFTVVSPTQITAQLAATGATGAVSVTTVYNTATRNGFTWQSPVPTITSFTPTTVTAGNEVIITGVNFLGVTTAFVNGGGFASFIIDSNTQIRARLSSANTSGLVSLFNPTTGTGTSATPLTVRNILTFPNSTDFLTAPTTVIGGLTYTATAQNESAGSEAWRGFGNDSSGMWWLSATVAPVWLEIEFPLPVTAATYRLFMPAVSTNNFPKGWQIQGWNGSAWVTLDTQTAQNLVVGANAYTIPVGNRGQYTRYRILITDGGSPFWQQVISRLELNL